MMESNDDDLLILYVFVCVLFTVCLYVCAVSVVGHLAVDPVPY